MVTAADLAADLGMLQDDDVRHILSELEDLHDDEVSPALCGEVRSILNPHGERTAPAPLYWPGHVAPRTGVFQSPVEPEPVWLWDDETP